MICQKILILHARYMPWSKATIIRFPPLRRNRACSPPRRKESFRFCPRVLANFRHFSQKSALKRAQIRAVDWAYRGPEGSRMHMLRNCLREAKLLQSATRLSPRSAGTELRSHASQTQLLPPPIGKNLPDSVREFSPILGTFPRKVH